MSLHTRRGTTYRVVACALFLLSLLFAHAVTARPPADFDPTLAPWYESLRQPGTGIGCCSLADCRNVHARSTRDGFQALIRGKWIDVPPKVILNISNPTGLPVACWVRSPQDGGFVTTILCFVPGPMT